MPRNTFLLVLTLAVFAALVVGVNIGRRMGRSPETALPRVTPTPAPRTTPTPSEPELVSYTLDECGVAVSYPSDMETKRISTRSAALARESTGDIFMIACQKDIPRPVVAKDKMEKLIIASVSASVYRTASPKDGTVLDIVLFKHPKRDFDVYLTGAGPNFEAIRNSLRLF